MKAILELAGGHLLAADVEHAGRGAVILVERYFCLRRNGEEVERHPVHARCVFDHWNDGIPVFKEEVALA